MLYELRVYEILPGRMPAMLARLERASEVFRQHGFDIVGVWTEVVDGNPRLIYINVYESLEAQQRQWEAFAQDPAWAAIEADSEKDGPIVAGVTSTFMDPAYFSPLK